MLRSGPRPSAYGALPEMAAAGLHTRALGLFRKHVRPGAKILDLGSGAGAWAKRLSDASYAVTACDLEAKDGFEFPYHQVDLNRDFSEPFGRTTFDAVSLVEVI